MRERTFEELVAEYDFIGGPYPEDIAERDELLKQYPYSLIVEGSAMEYDSLLLWIRDTLNLNVPNIFYSKTDYDFGLWEYFLADPHAAEQLREAVPLIYTVYPLAYPKPAISRSEGSQKHIDYDPSDTKAIIYIVE